MLATAESANSRRSGWAKGSNADRKAVENQETPIAVGCYRPVRESVSVGSPQHPTSARALRAFAGQRLLDLDNAKHTLSYKNDFWLVRDGPLTTHRCDGVVTHLSTSGSRPLGASFADRWKHTPSSPL
jgi:hypothetical protein